MQHGTSSTDYAQLNTTALLLSCTSPDLLLVYMNVITFAYISLNALISANKNSISFIMHKPWPSYFPFFVGHQTWPIYSDQKCHFFCPTLTMTYLQPNRIFSSQLLNKQIWKIRVIFLSLCMFVSFWHSKFSSFHLPQRAFFIYYNIHCKNLLLQLYSMNLM